MTSPNGIQFNDLTCAIAGKTVLGPLSLNISEARVGVIGSNGAGKSTLMRAIAGLIAPEKGRVMVCGGDVYADRRHALASIGVIFQNPDHQIIFPTVSEEIAFGLTQQGMSKEAAAREVAAFLAKHDRRDWADRPCHSLSQGQRHFLCLLSVLVMEPQVLVLDEPFAGLDIPTTMWLERTIAKVSQQVVLVTHDPRLLQDFDRVIWLEQGQIHKDGAPDDVLDAFVAEMTQRGSV